MSNAKKRLKVLVVDDDALLLRALQRTMRRHRDIELLVADNAVAAMVAVGNANPDLVVMDVLMPGLDGIEACRRMTANARNRDVRIIIASSAMTPEIDRAACDAGAVRTVDKPFDVVALVAALVESESPAEEDVVEDAVVVDQAVEWDVDQVFAALDHAKKYAHDLECRLEQLQQQLLARGTRGDVLKAAQEAVESVTREASEVLKGN